MNQITNADNKKRVIIVVFPIKDQNPSLGHHNKWELILEGRGGGIEGCFSTLVNSIRMDKLG